MQNLLEKNRKLFFETKHFRNTNLWKNQFKTWKFQNFPKSWNFHFFYWLFQRFLFRTFFVSKNMFRFFFEIFFHLETFYLCMDFSLYQSKNFPGIQKSYLENRAMNLNIRKTGSQTTDPSQRPDATRGWHNGWQPAISCHADTGPRSVG